MNSNTPLVAKKRVCRPKSRFGCRNCKLRKVKCDETKPSCRRCRTYGVVCNLGFNAPDLQPLSEATEKHDIVPPMRHALPSVRASVSNAIWASDGLTFFMLDQQDQELFTRFRYRTLTTLCGPNIKDVYEKFLFKASFAYPFLMHAYLSLAAVHDRYLGVSPSSHRSSRELYHWAHCTIQFNKLLSKPIKSEHKDPIWATACVLSYLGFASINACLLEEVWPLGPANSSDLEWLKLAYAKMNLWDLVNPLRPESAFRYMSGMFISMLQVLPTQGTHGISVDMVQLCGLDASSTRDNNPYFTIAHCLSTLLEVPKGKACIGKTLKVLISMDDEFRACLAKKDPVALSLLCLWYTRARQDIWWIDVRARHELSAIATYLQKYHGGNSVIQALIPWNETMVSCKICCPRQQHTQLTLRVNEP
ncbi:hypothetical protein HD806DRAFT_279712 [Xylariaceae sp. AK1471]|nr:hypothetical protein HD806DRAFT_279712 [Xylariaceae sp. AK1471]